LVAGADLAGVLDLFGLAVGIDRRVERDGDDRLHGFLSGSGVESDAQARSLPMRVRISMFRAASRSFSRSGPGSATSRPVPPSRNIRHVRSMIHGIVLVLAGAASYGLLAPFMKLALLAGYSPAE